MKKISPVFLLTLAVVLVYGNTLFHSFHFDDIPSILEKPWIRGLDKIPQFILSVWSRPLVILSFNLNHAISGFEVWSYHVFNILFHATAACLVYRLAVLTENIFQRKNTPAGNHGFGVPLFAAFIFALHPLSTQSVTYISSRSTILATVFYLAGLILFFKGLLKNKENSDSVARGKFFFSGYWFWAGVCFFLGILSKQTIVTLPVMMFLFHFYFVSSKSFPRWLGGQIKWMALTSALFACALAWKYFWGSGIVLASQTPFSTPSYLLTQTFVIPFEYFRKLLFPFNLNIDVNFPILSDGSLWANWLGVAVLLAYTGICVQVSRNRTGSLNRRWIGFGMAWILITLLPTSSFVPLLDVAVEHRTYLPMVGFSFVVAGMLGGLWNHLKTPAPCPLLSQRKTVAVCAFLLLVFYSAGVIKRNAVWKDEISLWADAKKKSPNLVRPHNNLGEAYDKRGEYDLAITEFEAALGLNPEYFFALNNLGNIYGKKKNYPKAIAYFEKALKQKADYSPAHYNLARALHLVGKPDAAVLSYREAIRFNPYFEQAFFNLANLSLQIGKPEEAIKNFLLFLKMQPDHARARFGLGNAYAVQGKLDLAYAEYRQSAALDPRFIFPQVNMANIEMQKGNIESAIEIYNRLLARDPKLAGIHKNLGMIFYQFKKDRDKAAFHFKESLRLEPDQPQADVIRSLVVDSSAEGETEPGDQ